MLELATTIWDQIKYDPGLSGYRNSKDLEANLAIQAGTARVGIKTHGSVKRR